MSAEFEYDVAFSFLKDDEPLAVALADTLADHYKSFVYSKKQEELVATDGQETFAAVFGERTRCVAVLYRDGWGATPWTRTEQTAIQNRALKVGWDFLLFIKLARSASMPKWLPHSYIWHDFERYGQVGAAGAISSLVQRAGGAPRVETLDDKAERVRREIAFEERRQRFRRSDAGVNAAQQSVSQLLAALEERAGRLSLTFKRSRQSNEAGVVGKRVGTMVHWRCMFMNSLEESRLDVTHWNGHPPLWGTSFPFEQPRQIGSERYEFDLTPADEHIWRPASGRRERALSPDTLADEVLSKHFERERDAHKE